MVNSRNVVLPSTKNPQNIGPMSLSVSVINYCLDRLCASSQPLVPPTSAVEVIESVMSVCPSVCVCVLVTTLMAERITSVCYACVCVSIHHGKTTFGQEDCTWGGRRRYVNAEAFSFQFGMTMTKILKDCFVTPNSYCLCIGKTLFLIEFWHCGYTIINGG